MTTAQIAQTIADLSQAMTAQRPTVSTSACTTPGCLSCTTEGGQR